MLGTQMPPVRLSAVSSSLAFLADVPRVLVNEPNPGDKTGNATPHGSSFEWKAFLRAWVRCSSPRRQRAIPLLFSPPTSQFHTLDFRVE